MQIPHSDILNTIATYKYFWFLSILQIHPKGDVRGMIPSKQKY